jgi:hypothetical protein
MKQELALTESQFFDRFERETWKGTITAFRNGSKYRLLNLNPEDSGYTWRQDFREAWLRGYNAMDDFLLSGGTITNSTIKIRYKKTLTEFER